MILHHQLCSFIDPIHSQSETPALFDQISEIFPITFDKQATKLEYHEFVLDDSVNCNEASDAVQFWLAVSELKSPQGRIQKLIKGVASSKKFS